MNNGLAVAEYLGSHRFTNTPDTSLAAKKTRDVEFRLIQLRSSTGRQ